MPDFDWNHQNTQALITLHKEGKSARQISTILGCNSRNAVLGKLMRLRDRGLLEVHGATGLKEPAARKPLRQMPGLAHVPVIKAKLREGLNDRQIASDLGLTPDDVRYVRRIKKIKGNNERVIVSYSAQLRDLVLLGKSDPQVAEALGITLDQARYERRRQGLSVPHERRERVTTISKGDSAEKVMAVFAEGFRGQRSRVNLLELQTGVCHFPIDQGEGPLRYCGDHCDAGQIYCEHHAARCYAAAAPRKAVRPMHVYTAGR